MFVYTLGNLGNIRSDWDNFGLTDGIFQRWSYAGSGGVNKVAEERKMSMAAQINRTKALSERQKEILRFIVTFFKINKYPPSIREIGETVGISSTSVVSYNLKKLVDEALLERQPDVSRGLSVNWDRLRELGMVEDGEGPSTLELRARPVDLLRRNGNHRLITVPVLGRIAAGEPIRVEGREAANPEDVIEMAEALVSGHGDLFALRVKGDSMIDASVLDGDIVILQQQETANDGDMVAAWIIDEEETTLKYLYREGKNVRLQPANPNPSYQPIIKPADKVRVNGKVVSVIRVL
jgi:repressor LexA